MLTNATELSTDIVEAPLIEQETGKAVLRDYTEGRNIATNILHSIKYP